MKIVKAITGQELTARLQGRMTFADHAAFRGFVRDVKNCAPKQVVLDLAALETMDSAGLGMLIIALDESKKGNWRLIIRNANGQVKSLLDLARLDTMMTIEAGGTGPGEVEQKFARLIYRSQRNLDVPLKIEELLAGARAFNQSQGITGCLWFTGEWFLQVLEGSSSSVNALFRQISADPRHREVDLIGYGDTSERHFAEWTMGYFSTGPKDRGQSRVATYGSIDPRLLSGPKALEVMRAVDLS